MTTGKFGRGRRIGALLCLGMAPMHMPAHAAEIDTSTAERIGRLDHELSRTEGLRQAKRLQIAYSHYAQFGLWNEMADLFARQGELVVGTDKAKGRNAILAYLRQHFGGGRMGLLPGEVATRMQLTPVISLAPDGRSAKGRWHEVSMLGKAGGEARWEGGISENDYVLEDGVWKIARLHLYPMYAGSYEDGWRNIQDDLPVVPFHYTARSAGIPIPPTPAGARIGAAPTDQAAALARLREIEARLARLSAEDAVMRLQNAYGYYVDQKMWTDVTDLFAKDGTLEIAGTGIYRGEQSIRRSFGAIASNGLLKGEVNEHLQMEMIVTVAPGGEEAWARGFQLGMLGQNHVGGWWTQAIFENHYVREGGLWRIKAMRLFPRLRSDYYQGWTKSQLPEPVPAKGYEPDSASTIALPAGRSWIPAFNYPNPVTGKAPSYPDGAAVLAAAPQAASASSGKAATAPDGIDAAHLDRLETELAHARARDGAENISHAFGYYLDDFNWDGSSALFARTGRRGKYQVGFYVGPERIRTAELTQYGPPRTPRNFIQIHLRIQPVIDVEPSGLGAKLRTRLFSFSSRNDGPGSFQSGMYPNDRIVLEDGVWKFQHQSIDELYFRSDGYKNGWAKVPDPNPKQFAPDRTPSVMDKLRAAYPPDVDILDMGIRAVGFGPGPEFIDFPNVKPMWFHYANPVSGRLPPNYCPDHSTCYQAKPLFEDQAPTR
ncbi:nuclear transport factor 2 family protein [Sphingobium lignivorans]|uniref:SnoaL-like domain-containing protein n=1 Tax=Sphingobium lignivorans TaxID=2735886 RepID=A0ABR6NJN4_9SPHN|nr:nuclear transport factor 2 family protein [Sphingobium lignivorans]MBB5986857.1 hypothetical protein [Sphingobium lignivorans]